MVHKIRETGVYLLVCVYEYSVNSFISNASSTVHIHYCEYHQSSFFTFVDSSVFKSFPMLKLMFRNLCFCFLAKDFTGLKINAVLYFIFSA